MIVGCVFSLWYFVRFSSIFGCFNNLGGVFEVEDLSICVLSIFASVTRFSIRRLKGLMGFVFVSKKVLCCGW